MEEEDAVELAALELREWKEKGDETREVGAYIVTLVIAHSALRT